MTKSYLAVSRTLCVVAASALAVTAFVATAGARVQSKEQQSCSTAIDKNVGKAVKAAGKELCTCLKNISKTAASPATCFFKDPKDKIAKSTAKAKDAFADSCLGNLPDFGFGGIEASFLALNVQQEELLDAIFGDDLVTALPVGGDANTGCQQGVAKAVKKCHDTRIKAFSSCKKKALKDGATDQAAITACVGADPKGKIAKTCDLNAGGKVDKVRGTIAKKCVGADLATAFPGCNTADPEALHACMIQPEACAACVLTADLAGDRLGANCDMFDNGADDNSCIPIAFENFSVANSVEPAETPGTSGVTVTNTKLIEQFGGTSFSLNNSLYTRWRKGGDETTPDAVLVIIAGFGGDTNNYIIMIEDLIEKLWVEHGLLLEIWAYHRRSNQLEDRAGSLLASLSGDENDVIDWYYGDELGWPLGQLLSDGPARRAVYYNNSDDIPFMANWTTQVASRDIDVIVEEALSVASNGNVFMAGHSAGTGFAARYAATNFELTGLGTPEPGYEKLRGLVMLEGGAGSTLGDPLTVDSINRIIAKADGGLFGAVRDGAPRCVDGTTPCTIETEAVDCVGQVPPVCTEPVSAYNALAGIGPEVAAASEAGAIQALVDPDTGITGIQRDTAGFGTAPVDLVPGLGILGILPDSTVSGLFGQFLDDDEIGATLSFAVATSIGKDGLGSPSPWLDITEPLPASATPDNGPAPTTIAGAGIWGQEIELVRMDRFLTTFRAGESNAADWYYETSGLSTTSAPGRCPAGTCTVGNVGASCVDDSDCAQFISLDSTAVSVGASRPDIVNLTEAADIDIPVICFGGSNGLTPIGASFLNFAKSISTCASPSCTGTGRVVDEFLPNEAFPTYGDVDGGYEVYIREGLAHNDVMTSEDVDEANILGPLAAFIARNVQ